MPPVPYSPTDINTARAVRGGLTAIPLAIPMAAGIVGVLAFEVDTFKGLGEVVGATLALVVAILALWVEFTTPPTVSELRSTRSSLSYFRDFATSIVAPIIVFVSLVFGEEGLSSNAKLFAVITAALVLLVAAYVVVQRGLPVKDDSRP